MTSDGDFTEYGKPVSRARPMGKPEPLHGSYMAVGMPGGPKGIRASLLLQHGEVVGFSALLGGRGLKMGMLTGELLAFLEREKLMLVRP